MKALVIDCNKNGLGVIRSLAAENVRIIAADHSMSVPGLHSKYVGRRCTVPRIEKDEERFISRICDIGREEADGSRVFLLPMNDDYLLSFAKNWDRLKEYFYPVFETDLDILLGCLEKTRMYRIAEQVSVPYPETIYSPINREDLKDIPLPLIVKPYNKKSPEAVRQNVFRLRMCRTARELEDAMRFLEERNIPYIVQRYITGGDDTLYSACCFSYKGTVTGMFTGRKLRQFPPTMGQCSYGEIIDVREIKDYTARLMEETRYTGITQVEFKKEGDTYYLMETNPRSWSWNSLTFFSGINLPYLGCRAVESDVVDEAVQKTFTGTWSYFTLDFWYNVIAHRNVSAFKSIKQAITADCHAFYERGDPAPAFYYFIDFFRVALRRGMRFLKRRFAG